MYTPQQSENKMTNKPNSDTLKFRLFLTQRDVVYPFFVWKYTCKCIRQTDKHRTSYLFAPITPQVLYYSLLLWDNPRSSVQGFNVLTQYLSKTVKPGSVLLFLY